MKKEVAVVNFNVHRALCSYIEADTSSERKEFFFFHFDSNQNGDIFMNESIILLFKKSYYFSCSSGRVSDDGNKTIPGKR